jgi:hypothetical protein
MKVQAEKQYCRAQQGYRWRLPDQQDAPALALLHSASGIRAGMFQRPDGVVAVDVAVGV